MTLPTPLPADGPPRALAPEVWPSRTRHGRGRSLATMAATALSLVLHGALGATLLATFGPHLSGAVQIETNAVSVELVASSVIEASLAAPPAAASAAAVAIAEPPRPADVDATPAETSEPEAQSAPKEVAAAQPVTVPPAPATEPAPAPLVELVPPASTTAVAPTPPMATAPTMPPQPAAEQPPEPRADPAPAETLAMQQPIAVPATPPQAARPVEPSAAGLIQPIPLPARRPVTSPPAPRPRTTADASDDDDDEDDEDETTKARAPPRAAAAKRAVASTQRRAAEATRASAGRGALIAYRTRVQAHVASRRPAGIGASGRVVIGFGVTSAGGLGYAAIAQSSGNPSLDRLALQAVRAAAPFPQPPAGSTPRDLRYAFPFVFR